MGHDPEFRAAAQALGVIIAKAGARLVYGGGHVGLMGVIADAVLADGGPVTGIIPAHLRQCLIKGDGMLSGERAVLGSCSKLLASPPLLTPPNNRGGLG